MRFAFLFLFASVVSGPALSQDGEKPNSKELSFISKHEFSNEALTTDKIAVLDPGQPNPHLRRWVVSRKMAIESWTDRKLAAGFVGVAGGVLESTTVAYVRPSGPWYQQSSEFPCAEKRPSLLFASEAGTRHVAEQASALWEKMIASGKQPLSLALKRVAGRSQQAAWSEADRVFQEWLVRLDHEWRARVTAEIESEQWKVEREMAVGGGFCKKSPAPISPAHWMVQEVGDAPAAGKPLTHAPARRWDGYFSVRMDVGIAESTALGQMLIDPRSARSVLSPTWMLQQGLHPEWMEIPEADPVRYEIEAGSGSQGLGKVMRAGFAKLSGYVLPFTRYLVGSTDIFDEPQEFAPCCSGVLGMDFLRRFVVEFRAHPPFAVQLWPVTGYRAGADYEWRELREVDGKLKAIGAPNGFADPVEMLLEASDSVIYDLPHGRIWFTPKEKNPKPLAQIAKLEFEYERGDRVLRVKKLEDLPESRFVREAGLKPGMIVTELDGVLASELDQWEVDRKLAGIYGDAVALQWKGEMKEHSAVLRLPLAQAPKD